MPKPKIRSTSFNSSETIVESAAPWIVLAAYCLVTWWVTPRKVEAGQFFDGRSNTGAPPGIWLVAMSAAITWIFAKSIANASDLSQPHRRGLGHVASTPDRLSTKYAVTYSGGGFSLRVATRKAGLPTGFSRPDQFRDHRAIGFRLFLETGGRQGTLFQYPSKRRVAIGVSQPLWRNFRRQATARDASCL